MCKLFKYLLADRTQGNNETEETLMIEQAVFMKNRAWIDQAFVLSSLIPMYFIQKKSYRNIC